MLSVSAPWAFRSTASYPFNFQYLLSQLAATVHMWHLSVWEWPIGCSALAAHHTSLHWERRAVHCTSPEHNQPLFTSYGTSSTPSYTLLCFHLILSVSAGAVHEAAPLALPLALSHLSFLLYPSCLWSAIDLLQPPAVKCPLTTSGQYHSELLRARAGHTPEKQEARMATTANKEQFYKCDSHFLYKGVQHESYKVVLWKWSNCELYALSNPCWMLPEAIYKLH